jgi:hypothetical protein
MMKYYNTSNTNWNNASGKEYLQRVEGYATESVPWLSMGIGLALGMVATHYIVKSF